MILQKKSIFILLILFTIKSVYSQLPNQIKNEYAEIVDTSISDEFNENRCKNKVDFKKWNYRRTKNSQSSTKYVQEKNGSLICRGIKETKKSGGIVSKQYKKHGFYTVKWKTTGIDPHKRTAWHPSVWSGTTNGQIEKTERKGVPDSKKGWLEIDFIEFENFAKDHCLWSADAPARVYVPSLGKKVKVNDKDGKALGYKKAVMLKRVDSDFSEWQTWGLEYHTDYLQLWRKSNDVWVKKGVKIIFNDEIPSKTSIPNTARSSMYWYIGNLYLPQGKTKIKEEEITDATLEVDWFRFYPIKK